MPGKHKKKGNKSGSSSSGALQKPQTASTSTNTPVTPVVPVAANVDTKEVSPPISSPPSVSRPTTTATTDRKMLPYGDLNQNDDTETLVVTESPVLTAVRALLKVIEDYNGATVNGLLADLNHAKEHHLKTFSCQVQTKSRLAVVSACAQFVRFATLTLSSIESEDFSKCKAQILNEGQKYLRSCERSIHKIARWAVTLIFDGARIMVHSDSLVVLDILRTVSKNIYFSVYIVFDKDIGTKFFEANYNIDVHIIRDAEVGTIMEQMDLVMVGAEAVLKNGGIINKVGTLPMAVCAREMNKPLYVLAESFKFSLMYPLSQADLPKEYREDAITKRIRVDYTLPKYITFLVTDRGLLTPTAVCDELIELYT